MKSIVIFIKRNSWILAPLLIVYLVSLVCAFIWSWLGNSYFWIGHGLLGMLIWSILSIDDYDLETKRFKNKLALAFHIFLLMASMGTFGLGLMGVLAWL